MNFSTITLKHSLENKLRQWGLYHFIHRPYYLIKTAFIGLLRPRTPLTISGITATFWTPTPILYSRIRELHGEDRMLNYLIAATEADDIFWDVGANIGVYSLILSQVVGKNGLVYAFEPEPQSYEWLCRNRQLNEAQNIEPLPMALGESEGETTLYPAERTGMGIHKLFYADEVKPEGILVPISSGDNLIQRGRVPAPTVIKIDVEGYEMAVLQGLAAALTSPVCRLLALEVHPQELTHFHYQVSDIRTFVTQMGFFIDQESQRAGQIHWLCVKH